MVEKGRGERRFGLGPLILTVTLPRQYHSKGGEEGRYRAPGRRGSACLLLEDPRIGLVIIARGLRSVREGGLMHLVGDYRWATVACTGSANPDPRAAQHHSKSVPLPGTRVRHDCIVRLLFRPTPRSAQGACGGASGRPIHPSARARTCNAFANSQAGQAERAIHARPFSCTTPSLLSISTLAPRYRSGHRGLFLSGNSGGRQAAELLGAPPGRAAPEAPPAWLGAMAEPAAPAGRRARAAAREARPCLRVRCRRAERMAGEGVDERKEAGKARTKIMTMNNARDTRRQATRYSAQAGWAMEGGEGSAGRRMDKGDKVLRHWRKTPSSPSAPCYSRPSNPNSDPPPIGRTAHQHIHTEQSSST